MSTLTPEVKRWIVMSIGFFMAIIGAGAYMDMTVKGLFKPGAAAYAATLVPGGVYFYPVLAIAGVIIAYVGYKMKS